MTTKLPTLPTVRDLGGDEFERLMNQLLLVYAENHHFEYEPYGSPGGDGGIDGLARRGGVPGLKKGPAAFQFKWLTGNLRTGNNARQIKESIEAAAASNPSIRHYVIVTPLNATPAQKEWMLGLSPRKDLVIHHWGHERIEALFRLNDELRRVYYPETARVETSAKSSAQALSAYLDWVIAECRPLKLRAIDQGAARAGREPLGLANIYIDLELTARLPEKLSLAASLKKPPAEREMLAGRGTHKDSEKERRVAALEALAVHPRLVLLGAPGSGKSTLSAYFALSLAEARKGAQKPLARLGRWWKAGALLPVRIILREFAASLPAGLMKGCAEHLWIFLEAEFRKSALSSETFAALRQAALDDGALFFLDGLDEAAEAATRERVLEAVTDFVAGAGAKCRFLVTSRPYAWQQATAAHVDWRVVYQLADFSAEQIAAFTTKWFESVQAAGWIGGEEAREKTENLQRAVWRTDLQPLASNPLLLTLMATLLANRLRLPDDRADLYDEVVKLLLQRWSESSGADRGLLDALGIPGLTLDHIRSVMQQLAYEAHDAHVGREGLANIAEGDLLAAFRPLLGGKTGKADLVLEYIEKRAGLLLGQGPDGRQRQFTFPHRTFQEFLAACWLADQPDFCERAAALARANPAHWREALIFAARQAKAGRGVPAAHALVHCQAIELYRSKHAVVDADWPSAALAGEQLLEIGLAAIGLTPNHCTVRSQVAGWLGDLLDGGQLSVAERCKAGAVLARLGDERKGVGLGKDGLPEIDWIEIPAGPFVFGKERKTCHAITQPYCLSRFPVTVLQYRAFVEAGGYDEERFWTKVGWQWRTRERVTSPYDCGPAFQVLNHPQGGVTWFEAMAFCRWLSERLSRPVSLPSEMEWERAARHTDGREFPWENAVKSAESRCNSSEAGLDHTSPVGMFPAGVAVCGAHDMSGNVWEWCRTKVCEPDHDGPQNDEGEDHRVLCGGSWGFEASNARCAVRGRPHPHFLDDYIGFRVVASPFLCSGL